MDYLLAMRRPIDEKTSSNALKDLSEFSESIKINFNISKVVKDTSFILLLNFNEEDFQYKLLKEKQQEIIDIILNKIVNYLELQLLRNVSYYDGKYYEIPETFILESILLNKSRRFNLQLCNLFKYEKFCNWSSKRNDAIKMLIKSSNEDLLTV